MIDDDIIQQVVTMLVHSPVSIKNRELAKELCYNQSRFQGVVEKMNSLLDVLQPLENELMIEIANGL